MSIGTISHWVVKINKSGSVSEAHSDLEPDIMDSNSGLFVIVYSGLLKNYLNMSDVNNFAIEPITTSKNEN